MAHGCMILKTFIKSSLDNYVLPGTLTGTEILWLYLIQWKRDLIIISFAPVYFIGSQFEDMKMEFVNSNTRLDNDPR